jgi:hypothetical protein
MAIPSRGIGWSQESNLLWQILKQLSRLTSALFSLKEAATPKYKVYTALLTQSGGDSIQDITGGDLTIGVTYYITDRGTVNWDFTNVGALTNNVETYFVATGTTPNSWGDANLEYNTGAPVVTVLENTIGNIWFTYESQGFYSARSNNLFINNKTISLVSPNNYFETPSDIYNYDTIVPFYNENQIAISSYYNYSPTDSIINNIGKLFIEIRIYN